MTQDNQPAPPALRFTVHHEAGLWKLRAGDVLLYDPARPRDARVLLERQLQAHAGHVDRMLRSGTLRPVGMTASEARAALIESLRADIERDAA